MNAILTFLLWLLNLFVHMIAWTIYLGVIYVSFFLLLCLIRRKRVIPDLWKSNRVDYKYKVS